MAVLFDPKAGSDRLLTGSTFDIPTNWSCYFWLRKPSTNGGGQPFSIGASSIIDCYYSSSTVDRLHIDRVTSGTNGAWNVTAANDRISYSATKWVFIAITQSGTSTPTVYTACPADGVALGSCTVTAGTSPTGTASTATGDIGHIGNYSGAWALGGDMEWWGFHNVVLTAGELTEAMYRGFTLRGAYSIVPMDRGVSTLYDLSGTTHSWTNSGASTTADMGAPVTPLWLPMAHGWVPKESVTTVNGTSSSTYTFTTTTTGTRSAIGSSATPIVFTETTTGTKTGFGTSAWPIVFTIASDGQGTSDTLGSSATSIVFTTTTSGVVTHYGASATPIVFTFTTLTIQTLSGSFSGTSTFSGALDLIPLDLSGSIPGLSTFSTPALSYVAMALVGDIDALAFFWLDTPIDIRKPATLQSVGSGNTRTSTSSVGSGSGRTSTSSVSSGSSRSTTTSVGA